MANKQDTPNVSKGRQSNVELLRILSMFLIIAHHFSVHGGFTFSSTAVTVNRVWMQFMNAGGKIGVNLFILIAGYFLVQVPRVNWRKAFRLWLRLAVYSVCITILFYSLHLEQVSIKGFIKSFMPLTFPVWWFSNTYFLLYLISPYLNRLIQHLSKKEHLKALFFLGIVWVILPTVTNRQFEQNSLLWFIYLYFCGAFIYLYQEDWKRYRSSYGKIFLLVATLFYTSIVLFDVLGMWSNRFAVHALTLFQQNRLAAFSLSVLLFLFFLTMQLGSHKWLNTIASTTFGIYLLHDHPFSRQLLWKELFKNSTFATKPILIVYSILAVVAVFAICGVIDFIMQNGLRHVEEYVFKQWKRYTAKKS